MNGNKIVNLLIPKDNIISNSDFVVLTPITFYHNKGRLKRGMCGLTRHNPQYKLTKKISFGYFLLLDSLRLTITTKGKNTIGLQLV